MGSISTWRIQDQLQSFFFDAAGRWRCGLCGREVPRPRGSRDLSLSKVDWEDSGGDM